MSGIDLPGGGSGTWDMLKSENLSGLTNYATARSNLWLGTAAQSAVGDFAPAFWFTPENVANKDTDITLAANSDTKYPSQKAVKTYIDSIIAAANAMIYKWTIDCSANPDYPAADSGWLYVVSVAWKIGGASGTNVEAWDMVLCNTDGTVTGDQAAVWIYWNIIQRNIDGYALLSWATFSGAISATNLSWTNTWDNATNTQYSWLAASKADVGQTFYIGTTQLAINRASAALTLAGLTLTAPDIGTPSAWVMTNVTGTASWLTSGLATSLVWGSWGTIPYQSAAWTTAMLANGTAGQVLTSNGTTLAPTWTTISGFSWGSSITGTTGTGSLLTMGNSYAAGGIGQSIVLGNTQTNDTTLMKLDMGTSLTGSVSRGLWIVWQNNSNAIALDINVYRNIGINVSRDNTTTQSVNLVAINNGTWAGASQFVNGIYVLNANATWTNFQNWIRVQNAKVSSAQSWYWVMSAGIYVDSTTAWWTSISAYGWDNVNTSTNWLVNYTLSNTQSGATVMHKIDLWTSSQGHTGIYVLANNASTSARGIKVDLSTAGTGTALEIISIPTTTGKAFAYNSTGTSTNVQANRSTDFFTIDVGRLGWSTGTWLDAFNVFYMKRTNATDTSGRNLTSSGSVLKLENIATPSLGTLSDTVDVLLLDQDTDSTWKIINARAGWTTKFAISATGALTTTPLTDGAVWFLNIPQNSKSAAYTTVAADSGKHIYHPSADTTARTWTIDSNANVAYPIGTALTFVNDTSAGVITIAITSDTLVLAWAGTTGSRTLAANWVATAIKVASTRWIINGTGLT